MNEFIIYLLVAYLACLLSGYFEPLERLKVKMNWLPETNSNILVYFINCARCLGFWLGCGLIYLSPLAPLWVSFIAHLIIKTF